VNSNTRTPLNGLLISVGVGVFSTSVIVRTANFTREREPRQIVFSEPTKIPTLGTNWQRTLPGITSYLIRPNVDDGLKRARFNRRVRRPTRYTCSPEYSEHFGPRTTLAPGTKDLIDVALVCESTGRVVKTRIICEFSGSDFRAQFLPLSIFDDV
jgi:hypothetical protein